MLNRRTLLTSSAAAAVGLAFTRAAAAGAAAPPGPLSPDTVRADLDLLGHAYRTVHPGLFRYLAPGEFDDLVERAKQWATRDRTPEQFYLALARLTAAVRCGHTFPNPVNQSRSVRETLFGGRDRLPFTFRWIDGRMIVTGGRGGQAWLPPGCEVLEVDGLASRQLLRLMMPLARADGANDAKRVAQLGLDRHARFSAFDVYRAALTPRKVHGAVALRVQMAGGALRTVELPTLTESELAGKGTPQQNALGWGFEVRPDGLGLLTMPTWVTYNSSWNWRAFLDQAVDGLIEADARGVIIDLRGNEGGSECGWHILERMVAGEVVLPVFHRRTRYRTLPRELRQPLDTWDPSFADWGAAAVGPRADGFYDLRDGGGIERIVPRGRRLGKGIAVLVDSSCSSATFQFANAIRAAGLGTLVGETTGGNRRGINGGAFFFLRLPATGFEVDLPVIGFFADRDEPDAGVVPHRLVSKTAQDLAQGYDRQLHSAVTSLGSDRIR